MKSKLPRGRFPIKELDSSGAIRNWVLYWGSSSSSGSARPPGLLWSSKVIQKGMTTKQDNPFEQIQLNVFILAAARE